MKSYFPVFILFFGVAVFSADPIAVSNLIANGISAAEAVSLTNALRSELGKSGMYQVMERGQMEEILKEQGFQQSGACDEMSCAVEMGKLLAVKYIALGNIGIVGKTYTLNVRIVDVASGKIIADVTENHKGSSDALLTDKIPLVSQKLTGVSIKKKPPAGAWIAAGTVVAAAVAIPVILISRKDYEAQETTDITVRWNE